MSIYLHDIPLSEAQKCFRSALTEADLWRVLASEEIPLDERALGRVLAEAIWAKISSPHYHASAMDGFAVRARETVNASPSMPVTLEYGSAALYLDTGDVLPEWANSVIPIENVEPVDEKGKISNNPRHPYAVRIRSAVAPWSHIRPMGEDIVATELILPEGKTLEPADLGAAAAAGITALKVARKPRVAILPTGSELVPIGSELHPGDIIEFNSLVLAAQIQKWGGSAKRFSITKDNFETLCQIVKEAAQNFDLILINAGSSAGAEDYTSRVVETLGTLLVHGVAVRPGHPVVLGIIKNRTGQSVPIIGVPGYPVSAALTCEIFVEPLLSLWLGRQQKSQLPTVKATLTRKVNSPQGDDDYLRVSIGKVNGKLLAAPLPRGAGMINSLVHADGIVVIPRGIQGVEAGEKVDVSLYRSPSEIDQTIFAIGSHDLTLDLLAQFLSQHKRRLVSVNAGSQGGLIAIRRGETHLAGSHLLDQATGEYNIAYIEQYLPDIPVTIFGWVGRQQGLLVANGNPKNIQSLNDLVRADVVYVNRQRGSGTRVLLDYELNKLRIDSKKIQGYQQEEFTHLAVAAAVQSGRADCGLAIAASANALQLDFIPLFTEKYQLVIPDSILQSGLLDPVFSLTKDILFKQAVLKLPGYDVSEMGEKIISMHQ